MSDGETAGGGEQTVHIAEDVVGVIASIAATEVEGVAGMSGGFVGGLSERLGKRGHARGVRVEMGEREAAIDLYIVVEFGVRIPTVAQRVQEHVKEAVESMTGLRVVEVNVHVQGVAFESGEGDGQEVRLR
ncbi:MAG: Asp23/Gls24 family envelope stress response protein [Clostridia bacterium]|nr:Asp23/Gls24 family envelope stress response protein [Clostridia bacterium]